ncbi:MAG: hypothetical protein JWM80_1445 [Cyanobacteria bacterium RYN_339]|nr:hypothetical protein [Cyanobacteria bacterium RYN_339]
MGTLTRDLLTGEATHAFDLVTLPFQSRLGAPRGRLVLQADAQGTLTGVRVEQLARTPFVAGCLAWLAEEVDWDLKAAHVSGAASPWLAISMQLRPEHVPALAGARVDGPDFGLTADAFARLMDDRSYAITDIQGRG